MKTMRNLLVAAALIVAGNMCAMDRATAEQNMITAGAKTWGIYKDPTSNKQYVLYKGEADKIVGMQHLDDQDLLTDVVDGDEKTAIAKAAAAATVIYTKLNVVPQPPVDKKGQPQPKADGWMKSIRGVPSTIGGYANWPARQVCQFVADTKMAGRIGETETGEKIVTYVSGGITTVGLAGLMYIAWTLTHTSSQEDNDDDADLDVPTIPTPEAN